MGNLTQVLIPSIPDWFFTTVKDWLMNGNITAVEYIDAKSYLQELGVIITCCFRIW